MPLAFSADRDSDFRWTAECEKAEAHLGWFVMEFVGPSYAKVCSQADRSDGEEMVLKKQVSKTFCKKIFGIWSFQKQKLGFLFIWSQEKMLKKYLGTGFNLILLSRLY